MSQKQKSLSWSPRWQGPHDQILEPHYILQFPKWHQKTPIAKLWIFQGGWSGVPKDAVFCREEQKGLGENTNNAKAVGTGPGQRDTSGDEAQDAKVPTASPANLLHLPPQAWEVGLWLRVKSRRLRQLKTRPLMPVGSSLLQASLQLQSGSPRGLCEGPIVKLALYANKTIKELGDNPMTNTVQTIGVLCCFYKGTWDKKKNLQKYFQKFLLSQIWGYTPVISILVG